MIRAPVNTLVGSRAHYLKAARAFFDARGYLEVDTSALSPYANIDTFIDPIETTSPQGFLHTSPEYAMKRLLANGSGDIYFLGHVFRQEYPSPKHTSEFTMVEWYKTETDEGTFLAEVHDFLTLFLGPLPLTTQTSLPPTIAV